MSTSFPLLDQLDICQSRHGGAEASIAAHDRIKAGKQEMYDRILRIVRTKGNATSKEIAAELGKQLNTVSGRFAEMKQRGMLKSSGETREGAAVLVEV